jgi:hypothetical protein
MKNENKKGFLLHAFTSKELDYVKLAVCCALSIKSNLKNNNITLLADLGVEKKLNSLTPKSAVSKAFDNIILIDDQFQVSRRLHFDTPWHNFHATFNNQSRFLSYKHSPYDETILLDVDYIVMNDMFDGIWGNKDDLLMNRNVIDLKSNPLPNIDDQRVSKHGIPLYWATVVYFRKSPFAETFFGLVDYIRENYNFYQFLYGFKAGMYRNDISFSIAAHILSGYIKNGIKPLHEDKIMVSYQKDTIAEMLDSREFIFLSHNVEEPWKNTLVNIKNMNVHIMNKLELLRISDKFIESCLEKI